jgi:phosphatidylinositol-3-phosphatase
MENEAYQSIIGSGSAPYITQLADACGVATNNQAVSHRSLPNYLAVTSGDTWDVADDSPPWPIRSRVQASSVSSPR